MIIAWKDVTQQNITTVNIANAGGSVKCILALEMYYNRLLLTNKGAGEVNYLPHCRAIKVDQKPFVRIEVEGVCKLKE